MVRAPLILALWVVLSANPLLYDASQLQRDLPATSGGEAEAHLGKGYEYIQKQNFQEAAREFKAVLSLNPGLLQARYQLAICEFALHRFVEARGEFTAVKKDAIDNAAVSYYLGRMDLMEDNPGDAIHRLSGIASHAPFQDTLFYLGSAYLDAGDLKLAEKTLLAAAKAAPRDFRVADHLARLYQKEKRTAEAEHEYSVSAKLREYYDQSASDATACGEALESSPPPQARQTCQRLFSSTDPDKLTLLGMLYGRHGDYQEALQPLQAAARLDSNSWELQHNLGLTYFRLRRYTDALPALEKAAAMRPEFFGTNALLGATYFTLKQDAAAYRVLAHAHALGPHDLETADLLFKETMILAQKSFRSQDYMQCLSYLREAQALNPRDQEVRQRLAAVENLTVQRSQ